MKKPLWKISAVGVVGLLALTACSGGVGGSGPVPKGEGDTIRITMDIPASFNPVDALSLPDYIVARAGFDTLVRKDDSGLVPGLAESWKTTPTSVDLVIRDGGTCSDGTPITASVVKDSLDYLATAEGPNGAFSFGGQVPKITADDAKREVSIKLKTPWPSVLQSLSVASSGIICPAGLADPKGLKAGHVEGAESGPYILTEAKPGVQYTFQLRDDYELWPEWTSTIEGEPAKTVKYVMAPDTSAASNLVLDGQLDIAKIMHESADRFDTAKGYEVTPFPFGDFYLIFNEREGSPFADQKVREAVAQAIDRKQFTDISTDGIGEEAVTFAKKQALCVEGDDFGLQPYDPEAAAAVLKGVKIRVVGPNVVGTNGAGNTYVQEMLRAAGAEVELENVDVGTWISKVFTEPDAWDMTVYADLNFLGSLTSPIINFTGPGILDGGTNVAGSQDPELEAAFGASLTAEDQDAQCSAVRDAARLLAEHAHGAPLSVEPYIYVQRPGVKVTMLGGSLDDQILRITG